MQRRHEDEPQSVELQGATEEALLFVVSRLGNLQHALGKMSDEVTDLKTWILSAVLDKRAQEKKCGGKDS